MPSSHVWAQKFAHKCQCFELCKLPMMWNNDYLKCMYTCERWLLEIKTSSDIYTCLQQSKFNVSCPGNRISLWSRECATHQTSKMWEWYFYTISHAGNSPHLILIISTMLAVYCVDCTTTSRGVYEREIDPSSSLPTRPLEKCPNTLSRPTPLR